jgi:hypothetical protein
MNDRHVINVQISSPERDLMANHHMATQGYPATHDDPLWMRQVGGRRQWDSKFTPGKEKQKPGERIFCFM